MSGKNALAFVAGLGSGYLSAQQRGRDQERQDKQDAWQTEQQDWQRQEQQQKTSLRRGLADATAPAIVNESGATLGLADGTKTVYDSADVAGSDFRQLRSADEATGNQTLARATLADGKNPSPAAVTPAPVGLASSLNSGLPEPDPAQSVPTSVGLASGRDPTVAQAPQKSVTMNGKAFDSTVNAKVAADAYNAPEARAGRMAAVYDAHGASDKALDLTVNSMKLGEMKQAVADKAVGRRIGALQTPEEVAKFISDYPHDGQGGELKTEVVRSSDGKTWGMVVVKSDGTRQPIPGDFTNDADGMTQAHITLLSKLNPEKRIEMYKWEQELNRKVKADANTARHQGKVEEAAIITAEAAKTRAANTNESGKPPAGYRKTADGNLEPIPGGPADLKKQGAFNSDTAALTGAASSFDRLATAANEVLSHPGLDGITGWRGKIPNIPGSDAANAEALLSTLKSQVGFGVLQDMRNQSKTGGALGAVSEKELLMLQSNLAALEKAQSPEQYRAQLKKIIDYTEQAKGRMRESFNMRHPTDGQQRAAPPANTAGQPAKSAPIPMPKEKSALQVGGTYQTNRGPAKWNGTAFEAP